MTQRDAISKAINDALGPVMARPERMEEAIIARMGLCDRLADAAVSAGADRMGEFVAVRDAAQRLMDYFEHSLGAGPLTNNPGKEAAYVRLLRAALARVTPAAQEDAR